MYQDSLDSSYDNWKSHQFEVGLFSSKSTTCKIIQIKPIISSNQNLQKYRKIKNKKIYLKSV